MANFTMKFVQIRSILYALCWRIGSEGGREYSGVVSGFRLDEHEVAYEKKVGVFQQGNE